MSVGRIILAGGSGFCGRLLATHFVLGGYEVVILTRSAPQSAATGRQVIWDAKTVGEWARELDGAKAVINLSGRSVNCRYNAKNRRLILDSRVLSTRAIGQAIAQCKNPPAVWLNASTATIYKHSFDKEMDENGEIASHKDAKDEFSVEVAQKWEEALNQAQTPNTRKVAMRMSMVFSSEVGTVYRVLRKLARLGLAGTLASGRQYVSWTHEEDYARAVEWLLAHAELSGPVNMAAPEPVTNKEMMAALRRAVGAPFGLPAARWMLEIGAFIMRTETELILKSRRVVPGRLLASGFKFNFPTLQKALADIENKILRK
jgi:hypothetical protein